METAYRLENATGDDCYGWFYLGIVNDKQGRPETVFVSLCGQGTRVPSHLVYRGEYRIVERKPVEMVLE